MGTTQSPGRLAATQTTSLKTTLTEEVNHQEVGQQTRPPKKQIPRTEESGVVAKEILRQIC